MAGVGDVFLDALLAPVTLAAGGHISTFGFFHLTKVDMTNIGHGASNFSIIYNDTVPAVANLTSINATALGLHDIYWVYLMDTCSAGSDGHIKSCTKRNSRLSGLSDSIKNDLEKSRFNLTLEDIHFPTLEIDGFNSLYHTMGISYYIAVGALFLGVGTLWIPGVPCIFGFISFITCFVATVLGTHLSIHIPRLLNNHLRDIGITASPSPDYFITTWIMLMSAVGIIVGGVMIGK